MDFLKSLDNAFALFLSLFPSDVHWLVALIVLVSLLVGFWNLIRRSWLFIILAILLMPFTIPALKIVFATLWGFAQTVLKEINIPK